MYSHIHDPFVRCSQKARCGFLPATKSRAFAPSHGVFYAKKKNKQMCQAFCGINHHVEIDSRRQLTQPILRVGKKLSFLGDDKGTKGRSDDGEKSREQKPDDEVEGQSVVPVLRARLLTEIQGALGGVQSIQRHSMDLVTSPPTEAPTATSTAPYGRSTTSISTSSAITAFPGSNSYPVFPNGKYLSKFYLVSGQYSGLNDLDYHLYNVCYLPYRPFDVGTSFDIDKRRVSHTDSNAPRPSYLINDPPCKRQAAINANCHFKNTNGTFSGLEPYTNDFDVQQQCYCEKYPFFDSALGCMKCFETHGGIEGT